MTGPGDPPPDRDDRLTTRIVRVLSPARAAVGAARLALPVLSMPAINAARLGAGGRRVVRVLGVRQVAQAGLTGRTPTRAVLWLGAEVDAAHAASMVGLAVCSRRYRAAALGDAAVAGTLAAAGAWAARHVPADPINRPTAAGVWRDRMAERMAGLVVPGYPRMVNGRRTGESGGGTIGGATIIVSGPGGGR